MSTKEEELRHELARLRVLVRERDAFAGAALNGVSDAVIALDAAGLVTFMNARAEALTGYTFVELQGQSLEGAVRVTRSDDPQSAPGGRIERTTLTRKDGVEVVIDETNAPIEGPEGPRSGRVLVFREASERRLVDARRTFMSRATALLASSFDYDKTLAEVCRLAVPEIADWVVIEVHQGEEVEIRAVAHADATKEPHLEETCRVHAPKPGSTTGMDAVLRQGVAELLREVPDAVLAAEGGSPEHVDALRALRLRSRLIVPIRAGERNFGVIVFATSETFRAFDEFDLAVAQQLASCAAVAIENARLYEAERSARANAELATRMREDLVAAVSHDLKNPLSSIVMSTALLQSLAATGEASERVQKYSEKIARAAGTMNRLIADLLDLASMESGSFAVACTPHEIAPLLRESLDILSPVASAKSLRLQSTEGGLGIWAHCDAPRVSQILSNLVGNAIKFTPNGGSIRVDVEAVDNEVRFSVSDTGPGIPEEDLEHIFERYWRARRERRTGIGLGLSIVKGLVEAHGGRVWVESRIGRGTTFFFTLRMAQASTPYVKPPAEPTVGERKRRLLVVDDDRELRESLCEFLEESGYDAIPAKSGLEALECLRAEEKPDLILLDMMMPGMNGWQFRDEQGKDHALARIPLLVMTSNRDLKNIPTSPNTVIHKPLRLEELLTAIERTCSPIATSSPPP